MANTDTHRPVAFTLRIDPDALDKIKVQAGSTGVSVNEFIGGCLARFGPAWGDELFDRIRTRREACRQ